MKTSFCLLIFCFLAFGQKEQRVLTQEEARVAWGDVGITIPNDTPQITGGALITEREINDLGRKVWVTMTQPGTYLFAGTTCAGDDMKFGVIYLERGVSSVLILDTKMLQQALPFHSSLCSVAAIRIHQGKIERSMVETNPWNPSPLPPIQVKEGISGGRYLLILDVPIPSGTRVMVGRSALGELQGVNTIVFSSGSELPPLGLTTITFCSPKNGECASTTFERKIMLAPSGKG